MSQNHLPTTSFLATLFMLQVLKYKCLIEFVQVSHRTKEGLLQPNSAGFGSPGGSTYSVTNSNSDTSGDVREERLQVTIDSLTTLTIEVPGKVYLQ